MKEKLRFFAKKIAVFAYYVLIEYDVSNFWNRDISGLGVKVSPFQFFGYISETITPTEKYVLYKIKADKIPYKNGLMHFCHVTNL